MDDATVISLIISTSGLGIAIVSIILSKVLYSLEASPKSGLNIEVKSIESGSRKYRIITCLANNNGKKDLHFIRAALFIEKDKGLPDNFRIFQPISTTIFNTFYDIFKNDLVFDALDKIRGEPKLLEEQLKEIPRHQTRIHVKRSQNEIIPHLFKYDVKNLVKENIISPNLSDNLKRGIDRKILTIIATDLLKQLNLVYFARLDDLIGGIFIQFNENLESHVIWPESRSGFYRLTLLTSFNRNNGRIDAHKCHFYSIGGNME